MNWASVAGEVPAMVFLPNMDLEFSCAGLEVVRRAWRGEVHRAYAGRAQAVFPGPTVLRTHV